VPSVDVNVGGSVLTVEDALVFFDRPQKEDDGVVHEGESLASFPIPKDGVVICLVLGLGEDTDGSPAPVWIRAVCVCHNNRLGLGGQLAELVGVDAFNEESLVKRNLRKWGTMVGSAKGLEKDGSENLIFWGNGIGSCGRSEAETLGNGSG